MPPINWEALGTWATFLAVLLSAVFVYGRLTERVSGHDDAITDLRTDIKEIRDDQSHTNTEIGRIKGHLGID